nr:MAG TPA: hypothetical protein [Caudoviricetes sp.]
MKSCELSLTLSLFWRFLLLSQSEPVPVRRTVIVTF